MNRLRYFLLALMGLLPLASFSQTVSTLAPAGSGMDDAMLLDSAGNIYSASYDNGIIYRTTPTGQTSVFATGFSAANGLEWDHLGNLVVCDNTGTGIYKIAPDTTISLFVPMVNSSGVIKDPLSDTLYVTQYVGNTIWKIAPDTTQIMVAQGNGLDGPVGLAWDENNDLLVGNFNNSQVYKIDRAGNMSLIGTYTGGGRLGFIVYKDGYIYGTSFTSHRIYRMDTLGNTQLVAGSLGGQVDGPALSARFNRPNGIIFSPGKDSLYITDYGSKSIRVITGLDSIGLVGIPEVDLSGWSLEAGPNPAHDLLKVSYELPEAGDAWIRVYDISGREVIDHPLPGSGPNSALINVEHLAPGAYHLSLEAKGLRKTTKVVIQ